MLQSIEIKNFKCFRQIAIEQLGKVNLFVGSGNAGKTSVLEAIGMLPGHEDQLGGFHMPQLRGSSVYDFGNIQNLRWLFHDLDDTSVITVRGTYESGPHTTAIKTPKGTIRSQFAVHTGHNLGNVEVLQHPSPSLWRTKPRYLTTSKRDAAQLARDFDNWTRKSKNENLFVEFLKTIEPRLTQLRPMEIEGLRILYADVQLLERIPLPMLGDGFNRLVEIYGMVIGEGAEIVLVDEIENGIHWSSLPMVWTGLKDSVTRTNVQIFATTHSLECIGAAVEVFRGGAANELAVHRLERDEHGVIHCVTMTELELERMLERGWEIR